MVFANNYRIYRVIKELSAVAGPIRPWFDQPGLGTQFYTEQHNVSELLSLGYLETLETEVITGEQEGCGLDRIEE